MLRIVDLFSGIGAFHQAAKDTGLGHVVYACDIDQAANLVYARNHHLDPDKRDLRQVKTLPPCDVVAAGFPCQDFSLIGKRQGLEGGDRGSLVFEVIRLLELAPPPVVIFENVERLATESDGESLRQIIAALERCGYLTHHKVLNALDFGVPQMRRRLFLVGFQDANAHAAFTWPAPAPQEICSVAAFLDPPESISPRHRASTPMRRKTQERGGERARLLAEEAGEPTVWYTNKSSRVTVSRQVNTLRANPSYNYLLIDGERRPSERELLRFQGFPDDFDLSDAKGYTASVRLIGNSIAVPVAAAVLRQVHECLSR